MNNLARIVAAAACCLSLQALAVDAPAAAPAAAPAPAAAAPEMTCGQMMAAKAELPAKLAEMITAMNAGMEMHMKALGKDGKAEKAGMMKLVKDHKAMIAAASKTSKDMAAMKDLKACKHDPKVMSDPKMMDGMTKQIALEKELASMMMKDAEAGEKMMADMKAKAAN